VFDTGSMSVAHTAPFPYILNPISNFKHSLTKSIFIYACPKEWVNGKEGCEMPLAI